MSDTVENDIGYLRIVTVGNDIAEAGLPVDDDDTEAELSDRSLEEVF